MPASPDRLTNEPTGMLTDHYEFTMLAAALREGTHSTPCTFELFARRLPEGRRYGVVAGVDRAIAAITQFCFDDETVSWLRRCDVIDESTAQFLLGYRFAGDIDGYPEGEVYFPGSPLVTVRAEFAEAVVLETVLLSIYNHDCAVAAAAARMVSAAQGRPIIEMGSRRTHEQAAVAAARAAYLAGFAQTSNLAAGQRYGIPTGGTAAHAFTLLHDDERAAFRAQIAQLGASTTLLVDTYDITRGIENAIAVAGPQLGAIRIDSGDLGVLAHQARAQLDALGARGTRIVVSGDLDEYAIAGLSSAPVDVYGAGTAVVTGSGAPTAGLIYKLVDVAGRPVAKRSQTKETIGGRKVVLRDHRPSGTATAELLVASSSAAGPQLAEELLSANPGMRALQVPLLRAGAAVDEYAPTAVPTHGAADRVRQARDRLQTTLRTLPWEALALSKGEPALPTEVVSG